VFLAIGLIVEGALVFAALRALYTYTWDRTSCRVTFADIKGDESGRHRLVVSYEFEAGGQARVSHRVQRGYVGSKDYAKAHALLRKYGAEPAGAGPERAATSRPAECWVNPRDPSQAVLMRGGPVFEALLVGVFPLIFIVTGIQGIRASRRGASPKGDPAGRLGLAPVYIARVALTGFMLIGATGTVSMGREILTGLGADDWLATPCRIISSQIITESARRGQNHRPDVVYSYQVAGQEYRSNRIVFTDTSSRDVAVGQAVIDRYPPGIVVMCYVDPHDPSQAVLDRALGKGAWMVLAPMLITVVAAVALVYFGRTRSKKPAAVQ
jgi:hypothetical protein